MFLYKVDENLSLKLTELNDAERIFELTDKSRDYLREWQPWVDLANKVEDSKKYIQYCLNSYADNKGMDMVILFDGEIIGKTALHSLNWSNKTAEIGYWIGEEYQGKGIVTKVVKALIDYAFSHLKLNKVVIRVAEGNRKSRRIPERFGFVEEGKLRQAEWLYDHYVDHVVYGLLAEEWK